MQQTLHKVQITELDNKDNMKFPIKDIIIGERQRIDLGDIPTLAESLKAVGQIQAIGINERFELIWGRRRLAAATLAGWNEIEVVQRTGLTHEQEQEIELEEDIKRKERTWQEKCLAIYKLFHIKRRAAESVGETWTQKAMADFVGLEGRTPVGYMLQVADALRKDPKDEGIWACEGYVPAVKLLLERTEKELRTELERRRQITALQQTKTVLLGENSNQTVAAAIAQEALIIDGRILPDVSKSEKLAELVTTTIYLHGTNISFLDAIPGEHFMEATAYLVLGHNPDVDMLPNIHAILRPEGFAVLWFDGNLPPEFLSTVRALGLHAMPWLLTWNRMTNEESNWPYTMSYSRGLVIAKSAQELKRSEPYSSAMSSAPLEGGALPSSVITYSIEPSCPPNMAVVLLDGVPPVTAAEIGHTPIWFEPLKEKFEGNKVLLTQHYMDTIPNVEVRTEK